MCPPLHVSQRREAAPFQGAGLQQWTAHLWSSVWDLDVTAHVASLYSPPLGTELSNSTCYNFYSPGKPPAKPFQTIGSETQTLVNGSLKVTRWLHAEGYGRITGPTVSEKHKVTARRFLIPDTGGRCTSERIPDTYTEQGVRSWELGSLLFASCLCVLLRSLL